MKLIAKNNKGKLEYDEFRGGFVGSKIDSKGCIEIKAFKCSRQEAIDNWLQWQRTLESDCLKAINEDEAKRTRAFYDRLERRLGRH